MVTGVEVAQVAPRVSPGTIWQALGRIPDPEVPAISIVELGIVRGVRWEGETLRVRVTPTYSGCPATDVIHRQIREALADLRIEDVAIEIALSPPWSTDWIAPEAKPKLRAFGIAPPGIVAPRIDVAGISPLRGRKDVACPRCGSTHTTLVAQFGSTACKALYRCEDCREPFDHMKPF
jgi:ring-1,2-phenylacetyl-CoA epoxidase subunit PaaD